MDKHSPPVMSMSLPTERVHDFSSGGQVEQSAFLRIDEQIVGVDGLAYRLPDGGVEGDNPCQPTDASEGFNGGD